MTADPNAALAALDRIEQMLSTSAEEKLPAQPVTPHERLAQELHNAQSQWFTLGSRGGSDDGEAA